MGEIDMLAKLIAGGVGVVALVIIIVVSISFDSLEYDEYGFARQKSTGKVDLSKVYSNGKHFIGPDYEFKRFKADAHIVNIDRISAYTQDKLEVRMSATLQYYLRKRDLRLLHKAFDVYYKDLMQSSAVDALKGAIPQFSTRDLFLNRGQVEQKLFNAVRSRLGGTCCPSKAECRFYTTECPMANNSDCDAACPDNKRGVFVEVRFFQLGSVQIPSDVSGRLLQQLILTEDSLREHLFQQAQIIRKQTDQQVRKILNDASELSQTATATSDKIRVLSQANYTNIIETARSKGLKALYSSLKITSQEHRNSFDYLRTLRGLDNIHLTVDFQQRIAGNL